MIKVLIVSFFILLCVGCVDDAEKNAILNIEERKQADSLFFAIKPKFEKDLDSLCLLKRDSIFPALIDSIKAQRIQEIEKIMKQ